MLKIITSKLKRHLGTNFLKDTKTNEFIAKVYNVNNKDKITQAFKEAYENMNDNLKPLDKDKGLIKAVIKLHSFVKNNEYPKINSGKFFELTELHDDIDTILREENLIK